MAYGGVGSPGGGFGGEADTGGVSGGSRGGDGRSTNSDGRDTPGSPNAADGKRGSTMGRDGGRAPGSNNDGGNNAGRSGSATSANGYGDTFGDSLGARSGAPSSRAGASMTGSAAMVSMDDAAEDAKKSFGGWASQVETRGPANYGAMNNEAYGRATAPSISSEAHTSALEVAGLPEQIARDARPGLVSRGASLVASLANPALGMAATAYGVHSAAKNAQQSISDINDTFGTTMDDSYGTALGQQTVGTASGLLGGKAGGTFGANAGMRAAGPAGAVVGGLLGSVLGSNTARDVAMGPSAATEGPEGPQGPSGGSDMSNANDDPGQVVAATSAQPKSSYVSIDNYAMDSDRNPFDRYSDYAAQFFGTA